MSDYRCTSYCPPFEKISEGKAALLKEIRKTHPKAQNIYKIVSERESAAHRGFLRIFNYKCCYCGCSVSILPAQLFEVDHLKPVKSEDKEENINALSNLVLACRICNGGKLAFWFKEMSNEWSPENGIMHLFFRDELFNIVVNSDHNANPNVMDLYCKLELGAQFRRLDFLLMSLGGYLHTLPQGSKKRSVLLEVYHELYKKRNSVGI